MSQDQRPQRPEKIAEPTPRSAPTAPGRIKTMTAAPVPVSLTKVGRPAVYLLPGLFIAACAVAGVGLTLLRWLLR